MRRSRATPRASPAKFSISLQSMATPSKFPRRGPPDLARAADEISRSAGGSMLFKIIAVVVATVLIYGYEPIRPLWIPFAIIPFIDRVAYRHSLKEVPLDVAEQVCITKDNTQLVVDGLIYFQVTDPRLASYGTSDYVTAIVQLAQTTLRSEVGKMELDQSLQSRDVINRQIVAVLDEAGRSWGVKVLRYEVKNLTPPEVILRAMQAQITAEREKRALIAKSEGEKQQEINLAEGEKQAAILTSEGQKQSAINKAQGEATALRVVADATAAAVNVVAEAIGKEGGLQAANLKVAELYIGALGNLAKTNNTMIVPTNLADVASVVASAMTVLDRTRAGAKPA